LAKETLKNTFASPSTDLRQNFDRFRSKAEPIRRQTEKEEADEVPEACAKTRQDQPI